MIFFIIFCLDFLIKIKILEKNQKFFIIFLFIFNLQKSFYYLFRFFQILILKLYSYLKNLLSNYILKKISFSIYISWYT